MVLEVTSCNGPNLVPEPREGAVVVFDCPELEMRPSWKLGFSGLSDEEPSIFLDFIIIPLEFSLKFEVFNPDLFDFKLSEKDL